MDVHTAISRHGDEVSRVYYCYFDWLSTDQRHSMFVHGWPTYHQLFGGYIDDEHAEGEGEDGSDFYLFVQHGYIVVSLFLHYLVEARVGVTTEF